MNQWGNNLRLSIFGESHGPGIGMVVDGLPAGLPVDEELIAADMRRRAPGQARTTARQEADEVELLSGIYNGRTTGAPIAGLIRNADTRSQDYAQMREVARPSHADYTAHVRYGGHNDGRGGGHFSGRLTAPLVFAGALCRGYLAARGVHVGAHLLRVGEVEDTPFDPCRVDKTQLEALRLRTIAMMDSKSINDAEALLDAVREQGDSVGGVIECAAVGVPAGWGSPFFASLEGLAASLLYAIPGVKGVEFGAGFALGGMRGSEANDGFVDGGLTASNHAGGINGGISNGMPVILRAAMRPTPTLGKEQVGLNMKSMKTAALAAKGRHDPCIAVRAVAVVEAALLLALTELALEAK